MNPNILQSRNSDFTNSQVAEKPKTLNKYF